MSACDNIYTKPDGTTIIKPKKKFDTNEEAIEAAKKINAKPYQSSKVVAYKCKMCHKFHVGRNGKKIKNKALGQIGLIL